MTFLVRVVDTVVGLAILCAWAKSAKGSSCQTKSQLDALGAMTYSLSAYYCVSSYLYGQLPFSLLAVVRKW